jgi:hypothetical protein
MERKQPRAEAMLAQFFQRNGYVRRKDPLRAAEDGQRYKKGYEIRLVARTKGELGEIRALLIEMGFEPGRPFAKAKQWVQPIYGKSAVERFLILADSQRQST